MSYLKYAYKFFLMPIHWCEAKNQIFYALCGRWNWWIRECLDETNLLPWFSFAITTADFYPYVKKWINNLEVRAEPDTLAVWAPNKSKAILSVQNTCTYIHTAIILSPVQCSPFFHVVPQCVAKLKRSHRTTAT